MQMRYISYTSSKPPTLLRKAVAILGTLALAGVALMFSAVLLVFLLVAGVLGFAFVWWKTRALRKQMREQMKNFPTPDANLESEVFRGERYAGEVIEGEAMRVDEVRRESRR